LHAHGFQAESAARRGRGEEVNIGEEADMHPCHLAKKEAEEENGKGLWSPNILRGS